MIQEKKYLENLSDFLVYVLYLSTVLYLHELLHKTN